MPAILKIHGFLLLGALLLAGQYAALEHSVEHLFHDDEEACQLYVGLEKGKNFIVGNSGRDFTGKFQEVFRTVRRHPDLSHPVSGYSSRAPPELS